MTASLSIDRAALEVGPLVLTGSRHTTTSGLWLTAGGLGSPAFQARYKYAPDSDIVDGKVLLAVARDQSTLPLKIGAQGADAADLEVKKVELLAALAQFTFTITQVLDGVTVEFRAIYSVPQWEPAEPWMRESHQARGSVVIPLNPGSS